MPDAGAHLTSECRKINGRRGQHDPPSTFMVQRLNSVDGAVRDVLVRSGTESPTIPRDIASPCPGNEHSLAKFTPLKRSPSRVGNIRGWRRTPRQRIRRCCGLLCHHRPSQRHQSQCGTDNVRCLHLLLLARHRAVRSGTPPGVPTAQTAISYMKCQ